MSILVDFNTQRKSFPVNYGNILEGNLLNFSWLYLISRPYLMRCY